MPLNHTSEIGYACSVAKSCPTLCDPMDCSPPGSFVHRIFQARILEWVAHSLIQGIFLTQRPNLRLLHWQTDSLLLSHWGAFQVVSNCSAS